MKNLLFALMATILLFSCTQIKNTAPKDLQIGTVFYMSISGPSADLYYVKAINDNGIFIGSKDWLSDDQMFIDYESLARYNYAIIPQRKTKISKCIDVKKIDNPLLKMRIMDTFIIFYGGDTMKFIVKEVTPNGLLCTTDRWLWSSSALIPFNDPEATKYFKYTGKYKRLSR